MSRDPGTPRVHTYRREDRLEHAREYRAAYDGKCKKSAGPIAVFACRNGLDRPRLGLSVGRRVGNAVTRNRCKRLVREAFRLHKHELPAGTDLVVAVRPHPLRRLAYYERTLVDLACRAGKELDKRDRKPEA